LSTMKVSAFHNKKQQFLYKNLITYFHVFIRVDVGKKALEQLYEGPYKVINRADKYFTIDLKGHQQNISIER
ncbi:hypothetical protein WH47_03703, partial [Habropoda laboriosa]